MIRQIIEGFINKKIISYLRNVAPESLLQKSEKKALKAFHRAARMVPGYQKIIKEAGINPSTINDIKTFQEHLPILDKAKTFTMHNDCIHLLCTNGSLDQVASILSSSGTTGRFSYGLLTPQDLKDGPRFVDFALGQNFHIGDKRTLLINGLPMGVKVPSAKAVVADVSVRKDMILSLVRSFGKKFEVIVMVGENSFMKEVLEFGQATGINWRNYNVRIIVGEEGFPENYRTYMAHLLGVNPDEPNSAYIGSSMGISELGLTVFQESIDTIRIRREAETNAALRDDLFGKGVKISPMLFSHFPTRFYLEEDRSKSSPNDLEFDLVFTNLDLKAKLPLIRYASGDRGLIITYERLQEVLHRHNLAHLLPEFKLPLVAVSGRSKKIEMDGESFSPDDVKASIYSDFSLPPTSTGNFRMKKKGNKALVEVQLKEGVTADLALKDKYRDALHKYINADVDLNLYPFKEFPYPLDYEKKFVYIE